jgi:hypothetical protein
VVVVVARWGRSDAQAVSAACTFGSLGLNPEDGGLPGAVVAVVAVVPPLPFEVVGRVGNVTPFRRRQLR